MNITIPLIPRNRRKVEEEETILKATDEKPLTAAQIIEVTGFSKAFVKCRMARMRGTALIMVGRTIVPGKRGEPLYQRSRAHRTAKRDPKLTPPPYRMGYANW